MESWTAVPAVIAAEPGTRRPSVQRGSVGRGAAILDRRSGVTSAGKIVALDNGTWKLEV
ncbi:hypothetical protein ACQPWY_14700 [Pseudonocardia xinjiangensis]|uniref:hypothetical protein n=1 Tax=Pseudonocardia xinjiangensis TaxID=75289 RepID=UPI003D942393